MANTKNLFLKYTPFEQSFVRQCMSVQHSLHIHTLHSLKCRVYSVQCTVYSVQCTVYSVHSTLYSVQCVQCTLYLDHSIVYWI